MNNKLKRILVNLSLSFASVLLLLLIIEAMMRVAGYSSSDWYAGGPADAQFIRTLKLNNLGFRGRDYAGIPPASGTARIMILGDSMTFGSGVTDDEAVFPALIEKELSTPGRTVQALNASRPGANTLMEIELFRKSQPSFHAGIVVICFFPNDVEPEIAAPSIKEIALPALPLPRSWIRNSYLLHYVDLKLRSLLERMGRRLSYTEYVRRLYRDASFLSGNRAALDTLAGEIRASGALPVIVSMPVITDEKPYPFIMASDYIRNQALRLGAPFFEPPPSLGGRAPSELRISDYNAHLNAEGHREMARAIAGFLKPIVEKTR